VTGGPSGATSRDARTFTFRVVDGTTALAGDVVLLREADGPDHLGQVLESDTGPNGASVGSGAVIGALDADGTPQRSARRPFESAQLLPAEAAQIEALQDAAGADLLIGHWASGAVEVPARLRAQGFTRHTFLCGQSGSGKTYALGVLLEQLLLGTQLRMVVLDPNADYVGLGTARAEAPAEVATRLAELPIRVLGADSKGVEPLRMRFATMPVQAQAAVLRLDPLADRDEYNRFLHLIDGQRPMDLDSLLGALRTEGEHSQALGQRIENLGLPTWEVWAGANASAAEVVETDPRMTVLDLSGFGDPHEPLAACLDLVERLWLQRESRTPTLVVIDEAHNICPAEPGGSIQSALVERLIQIAAEGRKYGLWLLLSTQRPSKIHPQVLSQCDNLLLMRMNSPGDLAELGEIFGFAPPALLRLSPFFVQGEALVAGAFVPTPAVIRMGDRLTVEGGSDLSVPTH
jgi:DNA helicase HerA-like ATPase